MSPSRTPDPPGLDDDRAAGGDRPTGDDRWASETLVKSRAIVDFTAARAQFAERAAAEGAVDVGFEQHESPFGRMLVGATRVGVVRVALPTEDPEAVVQQLAVRVSPRVLRTSTAAIAQARRQLDEYFGGARRAFDVPLDWVLTAGFRRAVLQATARIPYGGTASYGAVAVDAGSPNAVRAAGSALATNPLPILVPCHRVVRTGGALGQYLGGVEMKSGLLALEQRARKVEA